MPGPVPARCTFPDDFVRDARDTVRRRTAAVQVVQRYLLVLLLHEQPACKTEEAAAAVGLSPRQVRRWRRRWASAIFRLPVRRDVGASPFFPPLDQALIHALACEVIAETEERLSGNRLPMWCGGRRRFIPVG